MRTRTVIITAAAAVVVSAGGLGAYSLMLNNPPAQAINATQLSIGQKYLAELNYTEATAVLQNVIEVEPNNVEAYLALSKAYRYMGDIEAASDVLMEGSQKSDSKLLKDEIDRLVSTSQQPVISGEPSENIKYVTIGGKSYRADARELILRGCGLKDSDLSVLSEFTALEMLDISGNEITDISAVSGVTSLKKFYAANNKITDVSPLAKLPALEYVGMRGNKITDCSALISKNGLKYLHLADNSLTAASKPAESIELLYLNGNAINDTSAIKSQNLLYCDILN